MSDKTVYLIDGSSYIFRAYYAIHHLSTSKGFPTNAIYGFTSMIFKFIKDFNPEYLAIVFDSKGDTFRNEIYPLYKANRGEPPEDLIPQFPRIFEVADALGITQFQKEGYEADDIIGTIAKRLESENIKIVIVTGDKDFCQIVSDRITLFDTMKNKKTEIKEVIEKFGVAPEKVTDIQGLAGDSIDNIPGIKGVGEKTASNLINQFGSLEELLKNTSKLKGRQKALIEEGKDDAILSKELVTIKTDVDLDSSLNDLRYVGFKYDKLIKLFNEFEFKNLLKDIQGNSTDMEVNQTKDQKVFYDNYKLITSLEDLKKAIKRIKKSGELSIDLETTSTEPMRAKIVGIALVPYPHEGYYIPISHRSLTDRITQLKLEKVIEELKNIVEDNKIKKIGQNIKYEKIVLNNYGMELKGIFFDSMIAAHLIDSSQNSYSLDQLSLRYLDHKMISYKDVTGKGKNKLEFQEVDPESAKVYSDEDADVAMILKNILITHLEELELYTVYNDNLLKFIDVLAQMEINGVKVDEEKLLKQSVRFKADLEQLAEDIYSEVGFSFNLNSPLQLRDVLFDKLSLPQKKVTKTGEPSTDVEVLRDLAKLHPVPEKVLQYRALSKLKSTYIDSLPKLINPETGRIHTSFNQVGTSTGRVSSSDPNLQNIPIKSPEGRRIREAFVPENDFILLSADYSQIELRLLAHFSEDENLVDSFMKGVDIHNRTASEIFSVEESLITPEMRRLAKNINFGIIYGISGYGLAKQLGTSLSLASGYIKQYFERYKRVKQYIDRSITDAQNKGYAETIIGRRRYIPELNSTDRSTRGFGERTAMNTPIQGSAADIINMAMIKIHNELKTGYKTKMILQVHDELLFEVYKNELDPVTDMIKNFMENAWKLNVPINVDIGLGSNWSQAH